MKLLLRIMVLAIALALSFIPLKGMLIFVSVSLATTSSLSSNKS